MPYSINSIEKPELNRYGRKGLVVNFFGIFLCLPLLFASAGTIDWINGWIYFGFILGYEVVYTFLLMRINPVLLNERGKFVKEGTKTFDKIYVALYLPLSYVMVIISGLDAVRYGWSTMPLWLSILGILLIIPAFYLSFWAISVNSYFECTVLIQEKQKVCKSGPYRIIRHPGYAAGIVSVLAAPLILGSWWGLVPSIIIALMFIIRTSLEDRTLQKELSGYMEYTETTRYRLLPLIW